MEITSLSYYRRLLQQIAHAFASERASLYPDTARKQWAYWRFYWWAMKNLERLEKEEEVYESMVEQR